MRGSPYRGNKQRIITSNGASLNMNGSLKTIDKKQINARPKIQSLNQVEEEYIANLEKQVYYLELEGKLMKEKEVENRNNLGGYGKAKT
jgi:hypothetical protein